MKTLTRLVTLATSFFLVACSPGSPASEERTGFTEMPKELADCRIFAVSDGIRVLYITRCGFSVTTTWNQQNGKITSTENVTVVENGEKCGKN